MDDEQRAWASIRRGQHVRACRKGGLFEHHGVVIGDSDLERIESSLWPNKSEPVLIAEQNTCGLRIVSIKEFCTDKMFLPVVYKLKVVCYSSTSGKLHLSRPGACHQTKCLSEDEIVDNVIAILNNPQQRAMWKSYNLFIRNCEQFAVMCCTSKVSFGSQIPACVEGFKCVFVAGARTGVKAVYDLLVVSARNAIRIGEKLTPSTLLNGTVMSIDDIIKTSLKGNAIAAVASFAIEFVILTTRVLIYHFCTAEKREIYLTCKWAITWDDYAKRMTQAGFANVAAFGFSVLGMLVGVVFGGVGVFPLSILFGFVGYIGARWMTGLVYDKARLKFCRKQGYEQISRQMSKWHSQMTHIRHENDMQRMRTDIRHLEVKASSLQKQISAFIQDIGSTVCSIQDNRLMVDEAVYFIRRDLENLYKHVHELGDEHDVVSKQMEEMSFDNNSEYVLLSNMMEQASLSLFQLRFRIEHLAASIESVLDFHPETKRNEILENILVACEQLSDITNDLAVE